jgi:hypothetical protein
VKRLDVCATLDDDLGELLIVVVSRNVATVVYDGPAAAFRPGLFTSSYVSLSIVTDGSGLKDESGLLNITPQTVGNREKFLIYKSGNVLKITRWTTGNGPSVP